MKTIKIIVAIIVVGCYAGLLSSAVSPQSMHNLREVDGVEAGRTAIKDANIDQIIKEVKNKQESRKAKLEKEYGIRM